MFQLVNILKDKYIVDREGGGGGYMYFCHLAIPTNNNKLHCTSFHWIRCIH